MSQHQYQQQGQREQDGGEPESAVPPAVADALAGIAAALDAQRAAVTSVLAQDSAASSDLLELARGVEAVVRSSHGLLVQVLARMDEVKAVRGGVATWLTAQLGYAPGRARRLASDARRLRPLPQVAGQLSGGLLPVGAERVLARAAQAACSTERDAADTVAETLGMLHGEGMAAARRHVRYLEHTLDPGHGERQCSRQRVASYVRIGTCESGMLRLDALLDVERGTVVRAALDTLVSGWLRQRQYDHTDPLPDDVYSTEQLNAQALFRMAQVLLNAGDAQRAQGYRPAVLFYSPAPQLQPQPGSAPAPAPAPAPTSTSASTSVQDLAASPDAAAAVASTLPPIPPGCVETCYGEVVPAARVVSKSTAMHLTLAADGQPVTLDGWPIDQDADARLASRAQRIALEFLYRQCTYPGCTRPAMWSLHAHHVISYSAGGPTTMKNMTLLCSQHHVLTHQDAA
jgi:hypothetical protein